MIGVGVAIVGAILLVSVGLAVVELRKITPLAFRCRRCDAEFRRPAHRHFPRQCPSCGAEDWSRGI